MNPPKGSLKNKKPRIRRVFIHSLFFLFIAFLFIFLVIRRFFLIGFLFLFR